MENVALSFISHCCGAIAEGLWPNNTSEPGSTFFFVFLSSGNSLYWTINYTQAPWQITELCYSNLCLPDKIQITVVIMLLLSCKVCVYKITNECLGTEHVTTHWCITKNNVDYIIVISAVPETPLLYQTAAGQTVRGFWGPSDMKIRGLKKIW